MATTKCIKCGAPSDWYWCSTCDPNPADVAQGENLDGE